MCLYLLIWPFDSKSFDLLYLADPIHIPSVFVQLIIKPETLCVVAEFLSDKVAVVSSAYSRTFVSSFPITIPLYFRILSNGNRQCFNSQNKEIRGERITLPHTSLKLKIFREQAIIQGAAFYVFVKCFNPSDKIDGFQTFIKVIPL